MSFRLEQFTSNTIRVYDGNEVRGHLLRAQDGNGRPGWRWAPWSNKKESKAVYELRKAVKKACKVSPETARAIIQRDLKL